MADRNSHIDDVLLAKYLAGECSNEEKILVENWMNGDEKSSKVYQQSRKLFEPIMTFHQKKNLNLMSKKPGKKFTASWTCLLPTSKMFPHQKKNQIPNCSSVTHGRSLPPL